MEYVSLGASGLEVSPLAVGCMSFGAPDRGGHAWTLAEDDSRTIIKAAVDLGLNFFDTANTYSDGSSEEILGRALRDFARRDEVVLATKVFGRMGEGPNRAGLSRKAIRQEVDACLRRLGVDYIDLLQIHRFDPNVPLEETLIALDDLVRAGKVLYLGASSMDTWRFVEARERQRELGLARFISMQNQYSLIVREDERELLPYCEHAGVGVIPWSPQGRGKLTRPWGQTTHRTENDDVARNHYAQAIESDRAVVNEVEAISLERGVPMAHIALSWVRQQTPVSAPIVGATSITHLKDAVKSLEIQLTSEEMARLERPYRPRLPELY